MRPRPSRRRWPARRIVVYYQGAMSSSVRLVTLVTASLTVFSTAVPAEADGLVGFSLRGGGHSRSYVSGPSGRYHYGGYGFSHNRRGYAREHYRHAPGGHRHDQGQVSGYRPSYGGARHYYVPYGDGRGRRGSLHRRGYRYSRYRRPRYGQGHGVYAFTIPKSVAYGPSADANATLDERMAPGWGLLAQGRAADAVSVFAAAAAAHPDAGGPKAGYAIAQAMKGDLPTGVWAMRRALRVDPVSLDYVAVDEALRPRLRAVIERYAANRLGTPTQRVDGAFMVAALSYMLRDTQRARSALATSSELGDATRSIRNLQLLLEEADADTDRAD